MHPMPCTQRGLCLAHVSTNIPAVVRSQRGGLNIGIGSVALPALQLTQRCSVSALLVLYGQPRCAVGLLLPGWAVGVPGE